MMTIVCGIDFSESSTEAAQVAAAMAKRSGSALRLVHIIDVGPPLGESCEPLYEGIRARAREQARKIREELAIDAEAVTDVGSAPHGLIAIARHVGAHLIVVSSVNARKEHAWLLGSVAERVAQSSPIPVLTVRNAGRMLEWAGGERALRVMVGVDLGATSRAALRWAVGLRSIRRCDIEVTQIAWPFGEHVRLGMPSPVPFDRMLPELERILVRDLSEWVGDLPGPGETTITVTPGGGRVELHLAELITRVDPDLLVVGTHQRAAIAQLWQTSVSRGVLHHAECNVACVPLGDAAIPEERLARFRRVLMPTDFSPFASRAVPVAYGLVAMGGVVHLFHVATGPVETATLDPKERLRALIPRAAAARSIGTDVEVVREEDAAAGILRAAGRFGADAICMATHGRTGLSQLALGSVAQEVVRRSQHPVLLVPPDRPAG